MTIRILQANINHCARAQDLLIQSMAQWLVNVTVISEPYNIPSRDNWVADLDQTVALTVQAAVSSPPITNVLKGRGCLAALIGEFVFVAVYFSPNRVLSEFENFLVEVGSLVGRSHPRPVLVAGDFNAKSTAWGSPAACARGEVLEEWAIATGLVLLNRGSEYTCVRRQGGSIVDLTFASACLVPRVQGWKVLKEVETLSDHRYIRYDVHGLPTVQNTSQVGGPRWALKHLDRVLLSEASLVQAWVTPPDNDIEVEEEVIWFRNTLTAICDASMPRMRPATPRQQVYWWSTEIAELRRLCVVARRQFSHYIRRRHRIEEEEAQLYESYREAKKMLKLAIIQSKSRAYIEMLETLNRDPWGRPYKTVRGKLRPWAPPLTQSLDPMFLSDVVSALFPTREEHHPPPMATPVTLQQAEDHEVPEISEVEMRVAVHRLKAKNTAPGPDGIPGRAWVLALTELGPRLRSLLDTCFKEGKFPIPWKTGRLVLLRKEGRPAEAPSAYRPIVLLDEVGKLFERIIAGRLIGHLNCVGPDLDDNQFGFRSGRSTIGAIMRVKSIAEDAVSRGEVVLAVSLDIANAFNSLPWSCIKEALIYHQMPLYLRRIIGDYLAERYIFYETREGSCRSQMSCGVPQGSVLGPLLWNIGYDWVLRGATLSGITVTCYADDTLVTARSQNFRDASILATAGVAQIIRRIRMLGLEVALSKSEAICFHGPRRAPPPGSELVVGGVSIAVGSTLRYLGLVLDSRWGFGSHFVTLVPRLMKAAAALGGLLPNLKGSNTGCRRLYMGVVRSMAMYGAPVWANSLNSKNIALLRKPQRAIALRVIRGYRTISYEAVCVLAGSLPWDLDAHGLAEIHHWRELEMLRGQKPALREIENHRAEIYDRLEEEWQHRLANPNAGIVTIEAIRPVFLEWLKRDHGLLTFRLTQVLSGHGCFAKYLCLIGREATAACHHCNSSLDTAKHTLEECLAWADSRQELVTVLGGNDLSLSTVVSKMVTSETSWQGVVDFCETVLTQKENAERDRETSTEFPYRSRRTRRRRDNLHQLQPP